MTTDRSMTIKQLLARAEQRNGFVIWECWPTQHDDARIVVVTAEGDIYSEADARGNMTYLGRCA